MFPQMQLALPFHAKPALEELVERHPYWHFDRYQTKTEKVLLVKVETPQFIQLPNIFVRFVYQSTEAVNDLDARLKQAVTKQMEFTRLFV